MFPRPRTRMSPRGVTENGLSSSPLHADVRDERTECDAEGKRRHGHDDHPEAIWHLPRPSDRGVKRCSQNEGAGRGTATVMALPPPEGGVRAIGADDGNRTRAISLGS